MFVGGELCVGGKLCGCFPGEVEEEMNCMNSCNTLQQVVIRELEPLN